MIVNGVEIPIGYKYVKFIKSDDPKVKLDPSLKSIEIYGNTTMDVSLYVNVLYDRPIETQLEFLKLAPEVSLQLPNVLIRKKTYEDIVLHIIVGKVEEYEDEGDYQVEQELASTVYVKYGRIIVLLRNDEISTPDKLVELLSTVNTIEVVKTSEEGVGNLPSIAMRSKDQVAEYYSYDAYNFNETIATLDWSQVTKKYLDTLHSQLVQYEFGEPIPKTEQSLPDKPNLIKYDFGIIEYDGRGHLVGRKWRMFSMNKMRYEIELHCSTTEDYFKVLYEVNNQKIALNISEVSIVDNDGNEWNAAITFDFPVENNFDVNESKGTGSTTGNIIIITGFFHFFTISRSLLKFKVIDILTLISAEDGQ